jgi:hypothetical protein
MDNAWVRHQLRGGALLRGWEAGWYPGSETEVAVADKPKVVGRSENNGQFMVRRKYYHTFFRAFMEDAMDKRPLTFAERFVLMFLPVLTAVAGGLWAVWLFVASAADTAEKRCIEVEQAERGRLVEARRSFLEKRLKLYEDATIIAGHLVDSPVDGNWSTQATAFAKLADSTLRLVSDKESDSAIDEFRTAYQAHGQQNNAKTKETTRNAAMQMSAAFKKSIILGWTTATGSESNVGGCRTR